MIKFVSNYKNKQNLWKWSNIEEIYPALLCGLQTTRGFSNAKFKSVAAEKWLTGPFSHNTAYLYYVRKQKVNEKTWNPMGSHLQFQWM